MGTVRMERGVVEGHGTGWSVLRNGRYRVRRELGYPLDDLDDEAAADLALFAQRLDRDA